MPAAEPAVPRRSITVRLPGLLGVEGTPQPAGRRHFLKQCRFLNKSLGEDAQMQLWAIIAALEYNIASFPLCTPPEILYTAFRTRQVYRYNWHIPDHCRATSTSGCGCHSPGFPGSADGTKHSIDLRNSTAAGFSSHAPPSTNGKPYGAVGPTGPATATQPALPMLIGGRALHPPARKLKLSQSRW